MDILGRSSVVLCALSLCASAALGAQTIAEQKCIVKMNNAAVKLAAAKGRVISFCIKDFNNGVNGDADACVGADAKGKVAKQLTKVNDASSKSCPTGVVPSLAYHADSATQVTAMQTAGETYPLQLARDVFGDPAFTGGLIDCDPDKVECTCQNKMMPRLQSLLPLMGKVFRNCKTRALKIGKDPFPSGAASDAEIEACVTGPAAGLSVEEDPGNKIQKKVDALNGLLTTWCTGLPNFDAFAAGDCPGFTGPGGTDIPGLHACLMERARCNFCLMINDFDDLTIDCDQFDDASTNLSCP